MAKNVLRAELKLDTAKAKRGAKQASQVVKKFGKDVEDSTGKGKKGMDGLSNATAGFGRSIIALGATYVTLAGLQAAIGKIVDAYNRALTLRRELMSGTEQLMRTVAPLASQFGISETAAGRLVGQLGQRAGAGPTSGAALTGLVTSAASAGLIGDITETKGLEPVISQVDRDILVELAKFGEFTGEPQIGEQLAKLVKKGLGKRETTVDNVRLVLGQTIAAYRKSQLSKWDDFFKGAATGLPGILGQGVNYEVALSRYASLAKQRKSGVTAGATFEIIGARFFTADDPKMVEFIDETYGPGSYFRMKRDEPTKLFTLILEGLTSGEGAERAKRLEKFGIGPELKARLELLRGAGGEAADIEQAMRGATAAGAKGELDRWRAGQRATAQAGRMKAAASKFGMGVGPGKGMQSALLSVAEVELKRWELEDPTSFHIQDALSTDRGMREMAINRALRRSMGARGEVPDFEVSITGEELNIRSGQGFEVSPETQADVMRAMKEITGSPAPKPAPPPGTPVSIGIQFNYSPGQASGFMNKRQAALASVGMA